MRKKYLSALLFGALLFASAGTFTSCKDYDDDINNLQQQITSNKDAIAALQKLVGEGKWVSSVTPIENGFTVTMNDGTTQNITGINGEDGKPGTVITLDPTTNNWVIDGVDTGVCAKGEKGEQGEQGEQGETGEQGPAGEAGEPGKSPYIDKETGNWFVWEWDEATSEYKAVDSGVYAGSTQIYVVEKEGFIELNVDGTAYLLPTTSDAYTVEAPAAVVKVAVETAEWNPTTTSKDYQALLKAFPEIGKIEKDSLLKQGAELPVLVTPASIDLADGFKFSLQTLKDGVVEDITLSNPTKGISGEWNVDYWGVMSRAANADDCLWTLQVNQEMDEDGKYAVTKSATALVVENANGKVVKTPFAYSITNTKVTTPVSIESGDDPELADEIDLLAPVSNETGAEAPIVIENEFEGKYIITLANQLQVEKYGLSIVDGHKLVIANPGTDTTIPVSVNVIALGLNGSTANETFTINVAQTIASTGQLTEKDITLSTRAAYTGGPIGQIIKWDIEELGFTTATQLNNFINANPTITLIDKDENEYPYSVSVVKADGTSATYANADAFQFVLPSADVVPGDYKVVLEAANGSTVIYKTETNLTVANPNVEDLFALATAYTTDGKVLQVVGDAVTVPGWVLYSIDEGVVRKVTAANAQLVGYEDLDNTNWLESDGSQAWGSANWVNNDQIYIPIEGQEFGTINDKEGKNHLNKERNIRGTFTLFGNTANKIEYDFQIKVLSAVYTADGSNVKVDASKMAGVFGKTIDLTKGLSATYAAGINIGKNLSLFNVPAGSKEVTVYDLNYTISNDGYVVTSAGRPIQIAKADLIDFGMSAGDFTLVENEAYYIKPNAQPANTATNHKALTKGWNDIMNNVLSVYESKGGALVLKAGYTANSPEVVAVASDKAMFDKYQSQIVWNTTTTEIVAGSSRASELQSVEFSFADNDALKYCNAFDSTTKVSGVITAKSDIAESDLVDGKATVNVKVTIKDIWGLTMTKTFQVTITKE